MTFDVYTPFGTQHYTGDARYDVEHPGGGLLTVWTHDGDKITYGPVGWNRVVEWRSQEQGAPAESPARTGADRVVDGAEPAPAPR